MRLEKRAEPAPPEPPPPLRDTMVEIRDLLGQICDVLEELGGAANAIATELERDRLVRRS